MCVTAPSEVSAAFKESRDCWKRVDKGFDVIIKKVPDSLETKGGVDLEQWKGKEDLGPRVGLKGMAEVVSRAAAVAAGLWPAVEGRRPAARSSGEPKRCSFFQTAKTQERQILRLQDSRSA